MPRASEKCLGCLETLRKTSPSWIYANPTYFGTPPPPSKKHEEIEGVSFAAAKKYGKTTTKNELL